MAQGDVQKIELKNTMTWLDTGSKAFLILYGIGYFIESYYDSGFGIGYINPLRSKVGFTGIAFGIQLLAAFLLFTLEEVANNSSVWLQASKATTGAMQRLTKISYAVTWLVECAVVAMALLLFFAANVPETVLQMRHTLHNVFAGHHSAPISPPVATAAPLTPVISATPLEVIGTAASFLVMAAGGLLLRFTRTSRLLCMALATVGGVAMLVFLTKGAQVLYPGLFIAYAFFVALVRAMFTMMPDRGTILSSERKATLFLVGALVPILYAREIYGAISSEWGGAGASHVVVDFEREVPPLGVGSPVQVLEETDEGFYLISDKLGEHKALYVPRKDVKEVAYSSNAE